MLQLKTFEGLDFKSSIKKKKKDKQKKGAQQTPSSQLTE